MQLFNKVLEIFDTPMTTPDMYGWFHLLFWGLTIVAAVLLCVFHNPEKPERVRRIVFATAVIVLILEIYKQINFSFSYGEAIKFDYGWGSFPFQFCSTPMYVGLLCGIFKKGKIHDALMAYLATYAIFAGLCVMLYPGDVFIDTIGINIQTMICHGSMISIGVYLLYSGYVKLQHKTIIKAAIVFTCTMLVAAGLNYIEHLTNFAGDSYFNMFYFSPYHDPHLPLYSMVQAALRANNMPYILEFAIYVVGFSLAAYIMLLIGMLLKTVAKIFKKKPAYK